MANLQRFRNNATAVLSGALSQGGTTAVLSAGMGNRFDAPGNGDYFLLTLYEKDDAGNEVNVEVVKVTARVGDTLTIVRDVESLTGQVGGYSYPSNVTRTVYLALRWTAAGAAGMLQTGQNLADLGSVSSARGNLGLGGAATANIGTSAGTVAAGNHTHTSAVLTDLSPLGQSLLAAANPAAAQTSLGLGGAALLNVGTAAGTVAAGDHGHTSAAISDVTSLGRSLLTAANAASAQTALGLGAAATQNVGTAAGTVAAGNHTHTTTAITDMTALGISLATAASAAAARTTLGAGTSSLVLGTMSGQAATSSGSAGTSSNAAREDHTHPSSGGSGGGYTPMVVSANTTAVTNKLYVITATLTLTLPASPSVGTTLQVMNLATSPVVAANGANIMSTSSDLTVDLTPSAFTLTYVDATRGWVIQ